MDPKPSAYGHSVAGVIVAYDDTLPAHAPLDQREFHVIVEIPSTGRRMRLRANNSESAALHLGQFGTNSEGKPMTEEDVRKLLTLGATISFQYSEVWRENRSHPDYHPMDVVVPNPSEIERVEDVRLPKGDVIDLSDYFQARRRAR